VCVCVCVCVCVEEAFWVGIGALAVLSALVLALRSALGCRDGSPPNVGDRPPQAAPFSGDGSIYGPLLDATSRAAAQDDTEAALSQWHLAEAQQAQGVGVGAASR